MLVDGQTEFNVGISGIEFYPDNNGSNFGYGPVTQVEDFYQYKCTRFEKLISHHKFLLPDFGDDPTGKHLDEPGVFTAVLGHARRLSIQ